MMAITAGRFTDAVLRWHRQRQLNSTRQVTNGLSIFIELTPSFFCTELMALLTVSSVPCYSAKTLETVYEHLMYSDHNGEHYEITHVYDHRKAELATRKLYDRVPGYF